MWSIGCIFAELMTKAPIFMVKHEDDVLKRAFNMFGTPQESHCPSYLKMKKFQTF
jgi:hypothetical protein